MQGRYKSPAGSTLAQHQKTAILYQLLLSAEWKLDCTRGQVTSTCLIADTFSCNNRRYRAHLATWELDCEAQVQSLSWWSLASTLGT